MTTTHERAPSSAANATPLRSTCPPPSSRLPSRSRSAGTTKGADEADADEAEAEAEAEEEAMAGQMIDLRHRWNLPGTDAMSREAVEFAGSARVRRRKPCPMLEIRFKLISSSTATEMAARTGDRAFDSAVASTSSPFRAVCFKVKEIFALILCLIFEVAAAFYFGIICDMNQNSKNHVGFQTCV